MIGQTISHYEILEKLGEGGMGVVYKAEDTRLKRTVALKFLPDHVSSAPDEAARFVQEARAAAALNHPNICTIYGIEVADGKHFIVMEFVDGQTLQEKKTSLSLKQALDVGVQIGEGLAAAHEKGVIHRDIKPENIMIRKDGIALIMDFGLAKLRGASRLTKEGSAVGTAGYMSPEQVQGQETDHRSEIFSFGVLLFEMLTGQLPFKGVHETAVAYEIVNVDPPPMSSIKSEIPPELDAIVFECLEKDPKERTQSAGQIAVDLKRYRRESNKQRASRVVAGNAVPTVRGTQVHADSGSVGGGGGISGKSVFVIAAIALITVGAIALLKLWNIQRPAFDRPVHFSFDVPAKSSQILNWGYVLQLSPDGRSIAYTDLSGPISIIEIRDISNIAPYPVRGTEGGQDLVFENSNWLSFTVNGVVRKLPLKGGVPDISQSGYANLQGFSWGTNGEIVSAKSWQRGLTFQAGWDDKGEELTEIDASKNEGSHMLPCILPGEKAAVFSIWSKDGTFDDSKIAVVNLKTKERSNLNYHGVNLQGTSPLFLQTPWGDFLLWSRSGNVYGSSFDLSDLKVTGPEIKILDDVSVNASSGIAAYSVTNANNGSVAYMPGKLDTGKTNLVWVNKRGTETTTVSAGPYSMPSISRDGRALVILTGSAYKIGSVNFKEGKVDLLFEEGDNSQPKITPDGSSFVFASNFEDGKYNIYLSRLDGIGGAKKIVATEGGYPEISNLSPDGRYILYNPDPYKESSKVWIKDIKSNQDPRLLFNTRGTVLSPTFSPDGKFIAYRSDEIDGKFKLFARAFPVTDAKVQVSNHDGLYPQWSADGSEIYYRDEDKIIASSIQTKPELKVRSTRTVCRSLQVTQVTDEPDFAVAPDGRVLLLKSAVDLSKPAKVNVIINWFTELKNTLTNEH
jgi:serine/threonine protein kinase